VDQSDQLFSVFVVALGVSWAVIWMVERVYRRFLITDPWREPMPKPPGIIADNTIRNALAHWRAVFTRRHTRHPSRRVRRVGDLLLTLYTLWALGFVAFLIALAN
jgi:hypothetical protein